MGAVQSSSDLLSLSVEPNRDEVVVRARGELEFVSADLLDQEVRELADAGFERIVVDLRRVGFIDSRGLHVLLRLRSDASRNGHTLTLVPGARAVQQVFDVTATRELFDWREA